jgi:hypothetical protein
VNSLKAETIRRSFECCGIVPKGQKVEEDRLNTRLRDVLEKRAEDHEDEKASESSESDEDDESEEVNDEIDSEEEIAFE